MGETSKLRGALGEEVAVNFLRTKGYQVIGINFKVRGGEIDIIAKNKNFVIFVEVKTRKSAKFAEAKEFVTYAKQRKIVHATKHWLSRNPTDLQPRFDVIEVYTYNNSTNFKINHIENAFSEV